MDNFLYNAGVTLLCGSVAYLSYNSIFKTKENKPVNFAGEKLSDDVKDQICNDILSDLNYNNKPYKMKFTNEVDNEEPCELDNEESCELDNDDYNDRDYDEDDDLDYDEDNDYDTEVEEELSKIEKNKNYCNFPKYAKLRKGYYRIRFEDSDHPKLDYVTVGDKDLFNHIHTQVQQMILSDNGK
tara:strand:- start:2838 stop:3389 length:552 start_codon:yes stop_codon:yes gene_type:complete